MASMIQEEDEAPRVPEWVVTFGDMMSLLLTFFIMLVSLSEIKEEQRFQAVAEALRKRFGHETSIASMMPGPTKPRNSNLAKLSSLGRARRANTMNGGDKVKAPVGEHKRVTILRPGNVTMGGVVSFKEGFVELTEEYKRDLQLVAREIGGKSQKIEIRGHTSTKPLSPDTDYQSHWDLAYARSKNVMNYLIKMGINPRRIRLSVAGKNEPIHIGIDPIQMDYNPRVEVFMLDELVEDLKGTLEEKRQLFSNEGAP